MNSIKRILDGNFELNDSMKNYEEVSYVRPEVKSDKKGTYKEKVSYLSYKGVSEYPDNGIIGEKVEKVYEKCEHKEVYVFGSWYKCRNCDELIIVNPNK